MFQTLKKAWGVPEIRKKILYTLLMIVIFRFGSAVTVPFLSPEIVRTWMADKASNGNFLDYLNTLTGGALSKATVHQRFYHHAAADLCAAAPRTYA